MIFLFYIFLFTNPATATLELKYTFPFGKKTFTIFTDSLILSNPCSIDKPCEALRAWQKLGKSKQKIDAKLFTGGANPGAILCKKASGGEIVIGTDEKGNENSFCRFSDGSLVDNGSLREAWHKK